MFTQIGSSWITAQDVTIKCDIYWKIFPVTFKKLWNLNSIKYTNLLLSNTTQKKLNKKLLRSK